MPLDREAKVRIMHLVRALKSTEKGRHDVLHAMLWLIHDGKSGQCNPAPVTRRQGRLRPLDGVR